MKAPHKAAENSLILIIFFHTLRFENFKRKLFYKCLQDTAVYVSTLLGRPSKVPHSH